MFENSRSKLVLKLMQFLCQFDFWNSLLDLDFSAVLRMFIAAWFSWGSGLLEYRIWLYVRSSWFGCSLLHGTQLNSPARRPPLSVFRSLTSYNCSAPGRMLDILLFIPNTEYPLPFTQLVLKLVVCGSSNGTPTNQSVSKLSTIHDNMWLLGTILTMHDNNFYVLMYCWRYCH
jgi:hypothetical protein